MRLVLPTQNVTKCKLSARFVLPATLKIVNIFAKYTEHLDLETFKRDALVSQDKSLSN